jgi:diguanylate cyclase (GGDEF)-like protein
MQQQKIGFRDLLERILPLEALPAAERSRVERALRDGVVGQLEDAAWYALERLERHGAVRRVPSVPLAPPSVRYELQGGLGVVTLPLPEHREGQGLRMIPRRMLPGGTSASLEQVRQLLRLDEPLLADDPRERPGRGGLFTHLDAAGRELVGPGVFRFHPAEPLQAHEDASPPLDGELARDIREHPGWLYVLADAWTVPRLSGEARDRGIRSLVGTAVWSEGGRVFGHLEATRAEPEAFSPSELELIALLADRCGAILERSARIDQLVFIDAMTGVYNRSFFDQQVPNEMARAARDQAPLALCIADIDDFKAFNTAFGYQAGNEVLVHVANTLRHGVRPFDTVARWGGEEFAVLLTSPVGREDARAICERLRAAVERMPMRLEGLDGRVHDVTVTVSIGAALYPVDAADAQGLWRAANQALLEAKRPPKNRIVFHRAAS